jgi:uncharacterized protein (DUF1501 family)
MPHIVTRRDFMKAAAVFSAIGVAPQFLTRTAQAAGQSINGFKDDRVLVVVQLGGGNDGLNTLVPYADDAYYRARPRLGLKPAQLLKIDDRVALNGRLEGLKNLYDDGRLGIVQGVGYPNPDRSHFRSMEIWQTASDSDEFKSYGWIGRYFDHACSGSARPQAGVALGKERPQAFDGRKGIGVAFERPETFGWEAGQGGDTVANFASANSTDLPAPKGSNLDFLRHVTSDAIMSSKEVHEAATRSGTQSPRNRDFASQFDVVAQLIRGGLQTRIYYVSGGGFDTHANQAGQHDSLLNGLGEALLAFQQRLRRDGNADRVTTMVFSERLPEPHRTRPRRPRPHGRFPPGLRQRAQGLVRRRPQGRPRPRFRSPAAVGVSPAVVDRVAGPSGGWLSPVRFAGNPVSQETIS